MSPFSLLLHDLRMRYGVRQVELAKRMGYEQSYISALESGLKGPPTPEFVDRLIAELALPSDEAAEVRRAAGASQRKLIIESAARPDIYLLLAQLRDTIATLSPRHVQILRNTLAMVTPSPTAEADPPHRLPRRSKQEVQM